MQPESTKEPTTEQRISSFAVSSFHLLEHGLLIIIALLTIGAVAREVASVATTMTVTLTDILQMFLYTEVISMIGVFYTGRGAASPFVYPIFIAITALARLIVLQGKDMKPENIVFEASAILLLSVAITIILRSRKDATG
jgi:protein PsiE